jgi:hypothetical protein
VNLFALPWRLVWWAPSRRHSEGAAELKAKTRGLTPLTDGITMTPEGEFVFWGLSCFDDCSPALSSRLCRW